RSRQDNARVTNHQVPVELSLRTERSDKREKQHGGLDSLSFGFHPEAAGSSQGIRKEEEQKAKHNLRSTDRAALMMEYDVRATVDDGRRLSSGRYKSSVAKSTQAAAPQRCRNRTKTTSSL
ncbi:unnamed protein product, partial [Scytosiphon promiscuus]